jgi:hypothetical protein
MSKSNKAATIKLTHVYAAQGKSYFGELELETKVQEFAPPAPPNNLSEWMSAEQCRFISQPAGWIGLMASRTGAVVVPRPRRRGWD